MASVFRRVAKTAFFVQISIVLYRWLRLICVWIEEENPGIYDDAGFKVGISWTEDLGIEPGGDYGDC